MATVKYLKVIYGFFVVLLYIKTICATIKVFKDDIFILELTGKQLHGDYFDPINGLIVPAEPFDALTGIQTAPNYTNFSSFVLITNNDSVLPDSDLTPYKVHEATVAGFDLAIIIDTDLFQKQENEEPKYKVVLPTIVVDNETGALILERFIFKNETSDIYWLQVTSDESYYGRLNLLILLVIITCFVIILRWILICLYRLVQYLLMRRRIFRELQRHTQPLDTITYTNDNECKSCAICLEDYEEGERLRLLACQHTFHTKCFDPWLRDNNRTCPLCKRIVVGRLGDSSSNSDSDDESRPSSVTENALLLPPRESVRNTAHIQALAEAIINMMNQPSESETSDIENNDLPNYSEAADLLDNDEQPATIGSLNYSGSDIFVNAVEPSESPQSGIHV